MKTGIFLSVREKATRLPGKVLLALGDASVTEGLVRRLKQSKRAGMVAVATSDDPRDEVLCRIACAEGIKCFRGHPDDKLVRYRDAARHYGLEFVVIVDGDDPFVSVSHIDRIIDHGTRHDCDFVVFGGLPLGATGFGVSLRALEKVCGDKSETNTEVWGHLMTRDPALRCMELMETDPDFRRPDVRMTLDYPEDYEFFRTVTDGLAAIGLDTSFENVMHWLELNPEAIEINRGVAARYEAHIAKSRPAS